MTRSCFVLWVVFLLPSRGAICSRGRSALTPESLSAPCSSFRPECDRGGALFPCHALPLSAGRWPGARPLLVFRAHLCLSGSTVCATSFQEGRRMLHAMIM